MQNVIADMLTSKNKGSELATKEVMQEIILCALSQTDFFQKASFYGGTALRLFYHLDRFSEDLDFALEIANDSFSWEEYFPTIKKAFAQFKFHVELIQKEKITKADTRSAFLKENYITTMNILYPDELNLLGNKEKTIKIKFEVDTNPPKGAKYQALSLSLPFYSNIRVHDLPSLFAGKIAAILTREWKNRIKGRDLYDFLFYVNRNAGINFEFLQANLEKAGLTFDKALDFEKTKTLLVEKFAAIDYENARKDLTGFIDDLSILDCWNSDYFINALARL